MAASEPRYLGNEFVEFVTNEYESILIVVISVILVY